MRKPSTNPPSTAAGPLAVSPAEAGRLAGVGRTTIYAAISSGELRSLKIGTRRLVAVDALREWLLTHEVVAVTRGKGPRPTPLTPDFEAISRTALAVLPALLGRWLPGGRFEGNEYIALNPRRADRRPGSFKVNIRTGKWADFACDVTGGDAVSLAAYLSGLSQSDAARRLQAMLGLGKGNAA